MFFKGSADACQPRVSLKKIVILQLCYSAGCLNLVPHKQSFRNLLFFYILEGLKVINKGDLHTTLIQSIWLKYIVAFQQQQIITHLNSRYDVKEKPITTTYKISRPNTVYSYQEDTRYLYFENNRSISFACLFLTELRGHWAACFISTQSFRIRSLNIFEDFMILIG